jgi:phage shock protein E
MKTRPLVFLINLFAAALCASPANSAELSKEPLTAVLSNLTAGKALLVDVREQSEWDRGHIEGAVLLPFSRLKDGIDAGQLANQLPKDKIIYTYCVVGERALSGAKILEKLGYQVRALKPGYAEMVKAGFPKAAKK